MSSILQGYEKAPWLLYDAQEPGDFTKLRIQETLEEGAKYPMAPGAELPYPHDETPDFLVRHDLKTPSGLNLYRYTNYNTPAEDTRVIFYIHGGGFMRGNGKWCRANGITLARYLGLPVYCSEYRYAPEFQYPLPLDDCEEAWDYLTTQCGVKPEDVILAGESAGGTFIFALAARLKRKNKPLPGRIFSLSGFLDMALAGESYKANAVIDPVFGGADISILSNAYGGNSDPLQPELSPVYADVTGFPPTFFCADDHEVFASDSLRLAEKLHAAGIPVQCHISHKLIHAYPFEMADIPETKRVLAAAKAFLLG